MFDVVLDVCFNDGVIRISAWSIISVYMVLINKFILHNFIWGYLFVVAFYIDWRFIMMLTALHFQLWAFHLYNFLFKSICPPWTEMYILQTWKRYVHGFFLQSVPNSNTLIWIDIEASNKVEEILCENGRCKHFLPGFIIIDYWTIYVGLIFILKQLLASIFLGHFYLHNSF